MEEKSIVQISLNEEELTDLYLQEVQKHLEKMKLDTILMDSKQLCQMLSLSWPTIEKVFLSDPNFPSYRLGKKWIFNRKEVEEYVDRWCGDLKVQGGIIKG